MVAALSILAFMTLGAKGDWGFILAFRGRKLAALVLVAYTVAVSTVLFQTVTNNRILTPAVMGFDSLYLLVQSGLALFLGAAGVAAIAPEPRFLGETALLVGFSILLYRWLFVAKSYSLHLVILAGIVFGILFRSLNGFIQRILDPNEFMVLQDRFFASFNSVSPTLLSISAVIILIQGLALLRLSRCFDVLALGRPMAINLGLDHKRVVTMILVHISIMVAISTALVGPVTFFGLLVAALAHMLCGSAKHRHLIPAAILIAVICLVGGQVVLERLFAFDTALSIIIEFLGGLVFLFLLVRTGKR